MMRKSKALNPLTLVINNLCELRQANSAQLECCFEFTPEKKERRGGVKNLIYFTFELLGQLRTQTLSRYMPWFKECIHQQPQE